LQRGSDMRAAFRHMVSVEYDITTRGCYSRFPRMFVISLRHGKQPRKRKSKVSINSETRWIYRDEMV